MRIPPWGPRGSTPFSRGRPAPGSSGPSSCAPRRWRRPTRAVRTSRCAPALRAIVAAVAVAVVVVAAVAAVAVVAVVARAVGRTRCGPGRASPRCAAIGPRRRGPLGRGTVRTATGSAVRPRAVVVCMCQRGEVGAALCARLTRRTRRSWSRCWGVRGTSLRPAQ